MKIFALILAGGQGSRMGGVDKGLVQWHNKALIDHVIEKIRPQVSHIAISANRNLESYAQRSAHVFSDARQWQHYGPLAALCTAANDLQIATADWLLIVSCDMPRLPENLVSQFETIARRTPLCNAFYVETPARPHYSCKAPCHTFIQECAASAAGCSNSVQGLSIFLMNRILSATTRKTIWPSLCSWVGRSNKPIKV